VNALKQIIKDTLITLQNDKLDVTPENYFKEFKKQSELNCLEVDEIKLFNKLLTLLTNNEINSVKSIESFNDLSLILIKRVEENNLKKLLVPLSDLLSPSIDFSIEGEIEVFINNLSSNPNKLFSRSTITGLKELSKKRISLDRKVLRKKTDDIVKLTTLMGKYFDKSLIGSSSTTDEISKIKDELTTLNISTSSYRELSILQTKLIDTVYNIENSMLKNNKELNKSKKDFQKLHEEIKKLETELSLAKEEKNTDFLTGVLNRRAYEKETEKIEKKYSIFKTKYAVVFYDIDFFKSINDNYGHICGDHVLKSFAAILKGLTRQEDVISRYGGEEFIALINYEKEEEVIKYLKRVKNIIKNNSIVYQEIKINVKFSAGVSFRNTHNSFTETKKQADELLYKAKNSGRDKIIIDNGIEL
jgi:diguanylate cyclase (GGDEF)-like protein